MNFFGFVNGKPGESFFKTADNDVPPPLEISSAVLEELTRRRREKSSNGYRKPWTKGELGSLKRMVNNKLSTGIKLENISWNIAISKSLPGRSPMACRAKYLNHFAQGVNHSALSKEEKAEAIKIYRFFMSSAAAFSWKALCRAHNKVMQSRIRGDIGKAFKPRTVWPFIQFLFNTGKEPTLKRPWTKEEDETLCSLHEVLQDNWRDMSDFFNRTPEVINLRWVRTTSPEAIRVKGKLWSSTEKETLECAIKCYENIEPLPWNLIARHLENRTGYQCRDRFSRNLLAQIHKKRKQQNKR